MNKSIQNLISKLSEQNKEGFFSIKGGANSLSDQESTNSQNCDNSKCSGTNANSCTNSICPETTNYMPVGCTNSKVCRS